MNDAANEHGEDSVAHRHRRHQSRRWSSWQTFSLTIFTLIVVGAPLLFGAVDREVQVGLLVLLGLGVMIDPQKAIRPSVKWLFAGGIVSLLLAQFGPWQTNTRWRSILTAEYGVLFPTTRHPEPFRGLDSILAAGAGWLWVAWVRGLAADREARLKMVGILAFAGITVAVVCFVVKGVESGKIYGIRSTPGWIGWGPFPNRNHTASFLAMAALVTAGLGAWSVSKRRTVPTVLAGLGFVAILGALLMSKSRGGLVAFGAGMIVFIVASLIRNRSRRTRWVVLGFTGATVVLVMLFGGSVLSRFTSREAGLVSNDLRRQIWSDTTSMWFDAPLLGHGLGEFPQVFPLYTTHNFDGQIVRHPESSWLLWLAEVGAIPLTIAVLCALLFAVRGIRHAWEFERKTFYLTAGALAGGVVLLTHAVFDVPAHRWGTAIFGLALIGLAFPARTTRRGERSMGLYPLVLAGFWGYALSQETSWSAATIVKLEAKESATRSYVPVPQVPREKWEAVVRYFPIDPIARHYAGLAALFGFKGDPMAAEKHLAIARRLSGSSWGYAMMQARAYGRKYPSFAILAWQEAVLRAGRRSHELLRGAVMETAGYPGFWPLWGQFIDQHPELNLAYARALADSIPAQREQGRAFFDFWRERKGSGVLVTDAEVEDFHAVARWYADPAFLRVWIAVHPERASKDYIAWTRLFHEWGASRDAWEAYANVQKEPPLGDPPVDSRLETLESQLRASPDNPHIALTVAQLYAKKNEVERAEDLVLTCAREPDAPAWFLRKGAHILARRGQFADAVALVLKEK